MTKAWLKAAAVRAVKTMAQTFIAMASVCQMMSEVNWLECLSACLLAGILSIATSVAGLPEVPVEEVEEITDLSDLGIEEEAEDGN